MSLLVLPCSLFTAPADIVVVLSKCGIPTAPTLMLLVLDTNVLQADFQMRTPEFAILLDYLRKTQSKVVVPRIVLPAL